jgi:NADH dehydrogenase
MTPTADSNGEGPTVVVVGGGFAGVACTKALADHDIRVLLLDRNNYHQFQPLLYQVASAALSPSDVGTPLRSLFREDNSVDVKQAEVVDVDLATRTVRAAGGQSYTGDYLVLAVGSRPNYFRTTGADELALPLYSLLDAVRLRSRIFEVFDAADNDPRLVDEGVLNFVIVGAGATGVEIAGALAELVNEVLPEQYHDLAVRAARVYVVDHGHALLAPFSPSAHDYAAKVLHRAGVQVKLGVGVREITATGVVLSDGSDIPSRCVVWAGGVQAATLAASLGLAQGRGGRINVLPDLTVEAAPGVYVLGDVANVPGPDGSPFPQLGSVALQTGQWAAENIRADIAGKPRAGFHYHDKGIMAMIGRRAAVAEMGERRHELHGSIAFAAWLGVHAWLMSGVRSRVDAFVSWGWDYFSKNRAMALVDHRDVATLDLDPQDSPTPPVLTPANVKPPTS